MPLPDMVESFNLPPPPGFRGLQPDWPVTMYERHLPHWRQKGATYYVTFRLADSLAQSKVEQLRHWRNLWERTHPPPRTDSDWAELAKQFTTQIEAWMDEGDGECVFRSEPLARLLADALLHFQNQRYVVSSYVVMPNHCHVIVRPLGDYRLEAILDSWKGFVGLEVNKRLNRHGQLWQEESYDRIVRDEEHLFRVVQYIGRNPRKAGLRAELWHRWIDPEWERAGWGFRDEA